MKLLQPEVPSILHRRVNINYLILQLQFMNSRSINEILTHHIIIILELVDPLLNLLRQPLRQYDLNLTIQRMNPYMKVGEGLETQVVNNLLHLLQYLGQRCTLRRTCLHGFAQRFNLPDTFIETVYSSLQLKHFICKLLHERLNLSLMSPQVIKPSTDNGLHIST